MTTVSVVINTYNRFDSLRRTLEGLDQLDYENFEVVIVNGPSTDRTSDLLTEYADRIKVGHCPNRNLSESRNIGIALSAGDIVAFIDDDAYPDPAWLNRLVEGYSSDEIAGVGGPVYDYTGHSLQARYSLANRFGDASIGYEGNLTEYLNAPFQETFLYLIGTNASFLRERLLDVGGFDEEFEYYLDETDLCCRLTDRGYVVKGLDDGFVYHKFLSSDVRAPNRAIRNRFSVIKSRVYFALKHGLGYGSFLDVVWHLHQSVVRDKLDYRDNVTRGMLTEADYEQFESDLPRAFDTAYQRYWLGEERTRPADWFRQRQEPYKRYRSSPLPRPRLHLCLLSQEYPPVPLNGIARIVVTLATGLAAAGHVVHVLTRGEDHDRVDLEQGVWVHRVVVRDHPRPPGTPDLPDHLWNYSASLCQELARIHANRPVDLVQAPNWDSEGAAVIADGRFRTVVFLHTSIKTASQIDPRMASSPERPNRQTDQLISSERWVYEHADAIFACWPTVADKIAESYGITFPESKLGFVLHGLPDVSSGVQRRRTDDSINVLFVGRLEKRKGIDTLLEAVPALASANRKLRFTIAGNDHIPSDRGPTYRERFERSRAGRDLSDRVHFMGFVGDSDLPQLYADCDIFVAPSRFESFGLILLEAMMFSKPLVACDIGGMREIITHGVDGLLVPPGDPHALQAAIGRLSESPELRAELGRRARETYVERYTVDRMVAETIEYYRRVVEQVSPSFVTLPG